MAKAPTKPRAKRTPAKPVAASEPAVDESIVAQPDWTLLLNSVAERGVAAGHWRRLVEEMTAREILSASNGHALQRLVIAYLVYDRCSAAVGAGGIVDEPAADNPKAIARVSIHYKAMSEAEKTAERLEAQLGLTPGRRGKVAKVTKQRVRTAGADAFLGPKG